MFTELIVQPIFNLLTLIYAILPGHNFGLAIIIFTVIIRFALYPLVKKQLRHTKAMRDLQPEIKKIKEKTKGNRQQESLMMMELYKEREIRPMAFLGLMILQLVFFLALFSGLNRIVNDPVEIYNFSYSFVQELPTMQEINEDIARFDNTLFGSVDLTRAAIGDAGFYFPAFLLVLGSSVVQFAQIRQTMPSSKDGRKLRDILREASDGKQADSSEINAVVGRNMSFVLPIFIFVVTLPFAAALALYWFVGSLIAYLQQYYLLQQAEYSMSHAEVVSKKPLQERPTATARAKEAKTTKPKSSKGGVKVTTYTAGSEKKKPATTSSKKSTSAKKKRRKR